MPFVIQSFTWSCFVFVVDQVFFKLTFPSALLSTEVTLILCDSCVDRFVLIEIALV